MINNQNNGRAGSLQHALLPIHIIKKDSNGNLINRKNIHFQINADNRYDINYQFFMPKGYRLSRNSASDVNCRIVNGALNVPSVTFTYVKQQPTAHSSNKIHSSKPIMVRYVDADNGQTVKDDSAVFGNYGQSVNVLQKTQLPVGYFLLANQQTNFRVSDHLQHVTLSIRKIQRPHSAQNSAQVTQNPQPTVQSRPVQQNQQPSASQQPVHQSVSQPVHHHVHSAQARPVNQNHSAAPVNYQMIRDFSRKLDTYNQSVQQQLLNRIQNRDVNFFRKVVSALAAALNYQSTRDLKIDAQLHKVYGLVKKTSHDEDLTNTAYVRARKYDHQHTVPISEVRDFITSVVDHGSSRGIFITTGSFEPAAASEAQRHSVVTIDGRKLARLMVQNGIGIKLRNIYKVIGLDNRFFN